MTTSFAVGEIKALVRQPRHAEAQQLLERLAIAVLPILTRRCFRVRRLLEFFPKDGALLGMNVNRGAKIYVRLRLKQTPESFYPYEALLETLLHELTHMVHGPHNQAFYTYLDELKHEMESLMMRGLVGEEGITFADAGAGQRLGGNSVGVPICMAAVLAAKRREQYNSLLGGESSRRLGSATSSASYEVLNPQALRRKVLEAAERRRSDNEHCRNVLQEGVPHEVFGLESSDEDDEGTSGMGDIGGGGSSRQYASGLNTAEIIVLEDEDAAVSHLSMPTASHGDTLTIIDLLDDEDGDKSEAPRRPRDSSGCDSHQEQKRKRRRQDASDIIDLT